MAKYCVLYREYLGYVQTYREDGIECHRVFRGAGDSNIDII